MPSAGKFFAFTSQPVHFFFGEEEFKGAQIYDVIQDREQNFWISTNEGLIFYDHYSFKKIICHQSRSLSYFNFVINKQGQIFCNNLNNQVFKIENESCELFYTLEKSEGRSDLQLMITPENNLLVGGKSILILNEHGEIKNRFENTAAYIGLPFLTDDGKILISKVRSDSLLIIEKDQCQIVALNYAQTSLNSKGVLYFFSVDHLIYAINNESKECFELELGSRLLKRIETPDFFHRSESFRLYNVSNYLWVAGTLPGIIQLNSLDQIAKQNLLFSDYFISDVYEDREGNTLLSTFDKGIIVIPDLNNAENFPEFKNDHVTCIEFIEGLGLYVGTSKGKIASYKNGKFEIIHESGTRSIEVIAGKKDFNYLLFDDGLIRAYDLKNKTVKTILKASLKDATFDQNSNVHLATNNGLVTLTFTNGKIEENWVKALSFRNYVLEFDSLKNQLYVSTTAGLFSLKQDTVTNILYQGNLIYSSFMKLVDGKLYVASNDNGILKVDENNAIEKIELKYKNIPQFVHRFEIVHNQIYALTPEGMLEFDLKGNYLGKPQGQNQHTFNRVTDFMILNDTMWVSNANGLQIYNLDQIHSEPVLPPLKIKNILINDESISMSGESKFSPNQRKITFVLHCPTLRNKNSIQYQYRLLGYDSTWISQPYDQPEITYNALSPGFYHFQVRVVLGNQSGETISYSFSIATPFYATFWFISSCVLLFLLLVYIIYRYQVQALRKKSKKENELYASKLTAIRSQMNPHFIFNSLNSIQDLVLKGDVENSYTYITTFSNLVRRTLNYSDKEFVEFEDEIKLLELYLSLEKLRFKNDLSFDLDSGNITDISLPPMLIQPFIENALVHGLLHKKGDKRIKIMFQLNDELICIIEDNGIGREKAKEIKSRKSNQYESFSISAIERRFELLNNTQKSNSGFVYTDIIENGEVKGTKVEIRIPFKRRF